MGKITRKFDVQFKTKLRQEIASGKPVREACIEYQLSRSTVEGWLKKHLRGSSLGKPSQREKELEKENEKLLAKVGEFIMTIDGLKKRKLGSNSRKTTIYQSSHQRI